jgi:hypothetical protein
VGIQVEIFDVKEKSGAGLAADQIDKLRVGQIRVRPLEQIGDVFEQEWNGDP